MAVIEPDGSCKDGLRYLFCSMQQGEYSNYNSARHFNHGKMWTDAERSKLLMGFRYRLTLQDLNTLMGRTNVSIVKQLKDMNLIQLDTSCARYWTEVKTRDPNFHTDAVVKAMQDVLKRSAPQLLSDQLFPETAQEVQTLKEETMSLNTNTAAKSETLGKIETRIFVDNVDAATLTLDELLAKAGKLKDTVHKLEASAADFEKFGRVPAALTARIAEHRKNLGDLLDMIDTQFPVALIDA